MVIVIKHNGYPFRNNENAVLLATGITHHIVLLLKQESSQKTENKAR